MRIKRIFIDGYKNLNSFEAYFTSEKTVIIGQNASGKSNFLEAVVILFRNIDYGSEPEFNFIIHYEIKGKEIVIKGNNGDKAKKRYSVWNVEQNNSLFGEIEEQVSQIFASKVAKSKTPFSALQADKDSYLPKHIFIYYSGLGNSNRIEEILSKPDKDFALSLVNNDTDEGPGDRRFFYVQLHHSHLVLLSFYAFDLDPIIADFLKTNFSIEDLETILFVLKRPNWRGNKEGDPKFWGSRGVVKSFLNDLYK